MIMLVWALTFMLFGIGITLKIKGGKMLDRQWKYPLEYAAELYSKAADGFIYEARSLYTLLIAKLQSYTFTFDEIENCICILEHKIKLVWMYLAIPCKEYLNLLDKIKTEVNEIKQREAKQ